ncbi:hypothetical protein SBA4_5670017 [Candidatus Sulfopaludibacter sp. SbA4]|nr:hypothetical protein SBA4_5670017 [Candidatus Sulfopaludibacter sp. SbA4]
MSRLVATSQKAVWDQLLIVPQFSPTAMNQNIISEFCYIPREGIHEPACGSQHGVRQPCEP